MRSPRKMSDYGKRFAELESHGYKRFQPYHKRAKLDISKSIVADRFEVAPAKASRNLSPNARSKANLVGPYIEANELKLKMSEKNVKGAGMKNESKHLAAGGSSHDSNKKKTKSQHSPVTNGHPTSLLGKEVPIPSAIQRKSKGPYQSNAHLDRSSPVEPKSSIGMVKTHDKLIQDGYSWTGRKQEKNSSFENMGKDQNSHGHLSGDETIMVAHALMDFSNAKSAHETNVAGSRLSKLNSTVGLSHFSQSNNSWNMASGECPGVDGRSQVLKSIELFEEQYMKLLQEQNTESRKRTGANKRIDIEAAMILKKEGKWVNTTREVGEIPGVEIGDQFQYRAELAVVGLHTRLSAGIDYIKIGDNLFATCIVDSSRYNNEWRSRNVFIYIGEGGNPEISKKKVMDQELKRGNLALKTSMLADLPVRVVCCHQSPKAPNPMGVNNGSGLAYTYMGLYKVSSCDRVRDEYGKLVFKFTMVRNQDHNGASSSYKRERSYLKANDPTSSKGEGGTIPKVRGSY